MNVAAPRTPPRSEELTDAESEAGQVPQDVQGSHDRSRPSWERGVVRHVRPPDAGAGLDHGAPDRGRARGADASHQARRKGLDSDLPGKADHEEAGRNPHG